MAGLVLDSYFKTITLLSEPPVNLAEIVIRIGLHEWILPVNITELECKVTTLFFNKPRIDVNYILG